MKATALLENQHRKVEALFKKLEGGRSNPATVLTELANSLVAHMAIEQNIFYPAAKEIDDELINESYEEHALTAGSTSQAISYVSITLPDGRKVWGAGINDDIIASSINALFSAINRSI